MPLMDWDSFRQQAAQQNLNANAMPFVKDPATMSSDPQKNNMDLYGRGAPTASDPGSIAKAIEQTFRTFLGREPTAADMKAWLGGAANQGLTAQNVQDLILRSGTQVTPPGGDNSAPAMPGKDGMPGNPGSATPTFSSGMMSTYGTPAPSAAPGAIQMPFNINALGG